MLPRAELCVVAFLVTGCGTCGGGVDSLRAEEPSPHVRCLAGDPPDEGERTLGALRLDIQDRTLRFVADGSLRFAAFAGPAPGRVDLEGALVSALRESDVDFVVVLGDFGDTPEALMETLAALAALERLVLLVPGGRDDAEALRDALSSLDEGHRRHLIDVSGLDRVMVGKTALIPVAGAPGGRYGRTDGACGFTASDLEARAERLGERQEGERRYLLSWACPSGGVAVGLSGADAGDDALGSFFETIGASGGVHAWPREAAGRVVGDAPRRSEVVRRIAGPVAERDDGERPPVGPSLLSIGPNGLTSP